MCVETVFCDLYNRMFVLWLVLSTVAIHFGGARLPHAAILPPVSSFLENKIWSP